MRRVVAFAAVAALVAAPAAAAPARPAFYRFASSGRLVLALNVSHEPLDEPDLQRAIALALDRHSLGASFHTARITTEPVAPKYVEPTALAEATALAAPWRGTVLRVRRVGRGAAPAYFGVLSYQLAQIGLDVRLAAPFGIEIVPDIAVANVVPDYAGESAAHALDGYFERDRVVAIPVARDLDHVFVSGRVARVVYSDVYGVDLAALEPR